MQNSSERRETVLALASNSYSHEMEHQLGCENSKHLSPLHQSCNDCWLNCCGSLELPLLCIYWVAWACTATEGTISAAGCCVINCVSIGMERITTCMLERTGSRSCTKLWARLEIHFAVIEYLTSKAQDHMLLDILGGCSNRLGLSPRICTCIFISLNLQAILLLFSSDSCKTEPVYKISPHLLIFPCPG